MEAWTQLLRTIILTIILICHIGNGTGWRYFFKKKFANVDSSVLNGSDAPPKNKKYTHIQNNNKKKP